MTPRSPWIASAGCRKNAGVPVLVRVAAIFRQMIPDLPMPVRITRPVQTRSICTAPSNLPSRRSTSARIAAASVSSTFRASARSTMQLHLGFLHDGVDGREPAEQRLEQIQAKRVLRIALGARRVFVDLEEHAVDAGADARGRERLDVFRQTRRDAVAPARQLQAVRDVE